MALSTAMYARFVSVGILHIGVTIWMYYECVKRDMT